MTRYMIFPYTQASEGAKAVADELGGKRILRQNSTYQYQNGDVIINWGASDCPYPQALNYKTKDVTNKLKFFDRLKEASVTPRYRLTKAQAEGLIFPVFCRQKVEGRDGEGIVVANNASELVDAKLYVECINKTAEYRVHLGRLPTGGVVLIGAQKKWVPNASALANSQVWTGEGTKLIWEPNGQPLILPPAVENVCRTAFDRFPELTFGAFDVVYENVFGTAFVLEINSAPLMTAKTAKKYGEFFRTYASSAAVIEPTVTTAPAPVAVPPVQLTVSVPQGQLTMVQNLLAAVGVHFQ